VIDWTQRPGYLAWANERLHAGFKPGEDITLTSLSQEGSILAIVVFSGFTEWNCEVSAVVADAKGFTRRFIRAFLGYAFYQMKLARITAFVAEDNPKSLDLAQRLGFKVEGRARAWTGSKDAFLLGLLHDDAMKLWFKDLYGKEKPEASAGT
jgi:RimJ/RimL family protein N-acetyltransferase